MKERIIIDTDVGDDIDDALALALAINSPELELLGVTTVYKNTLARARLASWILAQNDVRIPVVPGKRMPISKQRIMQVNLDEIPCQYAEAMDCTAIMQDTDAVSFLKAVLQQEEKPVTVVTLGALTNIAVLLQRYPEIQGKIKRIVMMGGAYFSHIKEYNISCDPEAARIVFQSSVEILAVGLDVTLQCRLTEVQVQSLLNCHSKTACMVGKLINSYRQHHSGAEVFLHDAAAVAAVFRSDLVSFKPQRIEVETEGVVTSGMTFNISANEWWKEEQASHICVASAINKDALISLFLSRITGETHNNF